MRFRVIDFFSDVEYAADVDGFRLGVYGGKEPGCVSYFLCLSSLAGNHGIPAEEEKRIFGELISYTAGLKGTIPNMPLSRYELSIRTGGQVKTFRGKYKYRPLVNFLWQQGHMFAACQV